MQQSRFAPSTLTLALLSASLLAACGGSDDTAPAAAPAVTTALTGSVVKGPVNGADVCAFKATAAGKGDQLRCVKTNATGGYTMELDYQGDVVIEAQGGTYTDEATGATRSLADPMQVVIASNGGTATGVVTPLTSVAYSLTKGLSGGVSSANFASSATNVASQFKLTNVNIATATPAVTGTLNDYGRMLRAVSQYIKDGGTLAAFQGFSSPAAFEQAFGNAYASINGGSVTFSFSGGTATVTPGTGGGTTGGGATISCGIAVSGSGTASGFPFTLPPTKICVTGLPANACTAGNAQLQNLAVAGASPGGSVNINYSYSYTPSDCSGAISTVAFAN